MVKVNMNMNDELLSRVDAFAKKNYMTRSAVITFSINQFLATQDTREYFQTMLQLMREFALRGSLNDEQKQILEQVEKICSLYEA